MSLSKKERKKLRLEKLRKQSEQAQQDHKQRSEQLARAPSESNKVRYALIVAAVLILSAGSFSVYSYFQPGPLDDFAKCVSEKNAVMYGASWCQWTGAQKDMFGKSKRHLQYEDYTDFPNEELGKIKRTPTWVINGMVLENVQSLQKISEETGCPLP